MSELKLRPSLNGSILPRWGAPFEAQDEAVLRPYKVSYRKLSRTEPACDVLGVIAEDDVGASTLNSG